MKSFIALLFMALGATLNAYAEGVVWEGQPETFIGIRIGAAASEIPDCGKGVLGLCKEDEAPSADEKYRSAWDIKNLPDLGFEYWAFVSGDANGNIVHVLLTTDAPNALELRDIANERYGLVPGTFWDDTERWGALGGYVRTWEGELSRIVFTHVDGEKGGVPLVTLEAFLVPNSLEAFLREKAEQKAEAERKAREIPKKARLL